MIGAPLNFKHVYHFGGGEHDLNSDQLSTQTSSTILRSANSSDLGEKSPTQSDVIDKKYSRRSFYKDDYWLPIYVIRGHFLCVSQGAHSFEKFLDFWGKKILRL